MANPGCLLNPGFPFNLALHSPTSNTWTDRLTRHIPYSHDHKAWKIGRFAHFKTNTATFSHQARESPYQSPFAQQWANYFQPMAFPKLFGGVPSNRIVKTNPCHPFTDKGDGLGERLHTKSRYKQLFWWGNFDLLLLRTVLPLDYPPLWNRAYGR